MILFINACARSDSRTKKIADYLLSNTKETVEELILSEFKFPVVDEDYLAKRDEFTAERKFDAPMFKPARQFAKADKIVIAAPFWDLSFPAVLKQYFEQINVVGVTFNYSDDGIPVGLCKASELYYITTVGGTYFPEEYGFGYVKSLAESFYGIKDVKLIKAVGLDIAGADVEEIMRKCIEKIQPV